MSPNININPDIPSLEDSAPYGQGLTKMQVARRWHEWLRRLLSHPAVFGRSTSDIACKVRVIIARGHTVHSKTGWSIQITAHSACALTTTMDDPNTPESARTVAPSPSPDSDQHLHNEKKLRVTTSAPLAAVQSQSNYDTYRDSPPALSYSLDEHGRKRYILVWFALLFTEAGILPLILFFALRWGAHLSITINLAIITSLIGSVSGYKFAQR
ncbi:hypothetical protein FIBSPDRAFT_936383, partial [Athelia psychrophila]